jgi:hypothetical protein
MPCDAVAFAEVGISDKTTIELLNRNGEVVATFAVQFAQAMGLVARRVDVGGNRVEIASGEMAVTIAEGRVRARGQGWRVSQSDVDAFVEDLKAALGDLAGELLEAEIRQILMDAGGVIEDQVSQGPLTLLTVSL